LIDNNTTEVMKDAIGEIEVIKEKEDKFVRIPMKMFAYGSDSYVTDDEYVVYYEIVYHLWGRDISVTNTNVEMLYARIGWDVKTPTRGKKRIIEALEGLKVKGYINIDSNGDEIKANTYLIIHSPRIKSKIFDEKIVVEGTTYTAWQGVTELIMKASKLDVNKIGQRLKVLTYIMWRYNIDYSISFDEWANVLQVSVSTAKRIIKSLKEEGLIDVVSGTYYTDLDGKVRQEINKYGISKEVEEDKDAYKPTITGKQRKFMKVLELMTLTTDNRIVERNNLLDYGSKLGVEDMIIYLTSDCTVVKEYGKKRFDAIKKNAKGKAMVEAWETKAKEQIVNDSKPSIIKEPSEPVYEVASEIKENHSIVEIETTSYEDEDISSRFRQSQIRREELERKKREEENERFRKEMMELDDEDDVSGF